MQDSGGEIFFYCGVYIVETQFSLKQMHFDVNESFKNFTISSYWSIKWSLISVIIL